MVKNFNNSLDVRKLVNVQEMIKDNYMTVKTMVEGFKDTLNITLAMIAMVMRADSAITMKYVWGWSVMFDVSESFVLNHNEGLCIGIYDENGDHYMVNYETYRFLLFFKKLTMLEVLKDQPLTKEETLLYRDVDFSGKTIMKVHRVALKRDINECMSKYYNEQIYKLNHKEEE